MNNVSDLLKRDCGSRFGRAILGLVVSIIALCNLNVTWNILNILVLIIYLSFSIAVLVCFFFNEICSNLKCLNVYVSTSSNAVIRLLSAIFFKINKAK